MHIPESSRLPADTLRPAAGKPSRRSQRRSWRRLGRFAAATVLLGALISAGCQGESSQLPKYSSARHVCRYVRNYRVPGRTRRVVTVFEIVSEEAKGQRFGVLLSEKTLTARQAELLEVIAKVEKVGGSFFAEFMIFTDHLSATDPGRNYDFIDFEKWSIVKWIRPEDQQRYLRYLAPVRRRDGSQPG